MRRSRFREAMAGRNRASGDGHASALDHRRGRAGRAAGAGADDAEHRRGGLAGQQHLPQHCDESAGGEGVQPGRDQSDSFCGAALSFFPRGGLPGGGGSSPAGRAAAGALRCCLRLSGLAHHPCPFRPDARSDRLCAGALLAGADGHQHLSIHREFLHLSLSARHLAGDARSGTAFSGCSGSCRSGRRSGDPDPGRDHAAAACPAAGFSAAAPGSTAVAPAYAALRPLLRAADRALDHAQLSHLRRCRADRRGVGGCALDRQLPAA